MSLTEPSQRRKQPVKLTDIPLATRAKYARILIRQGEDSAEMLDAAALPSQTVYYVTDDRLAA